MLHRAQLAPDVTGLADHHHASNGREGWARRRCRHILRLGPGCVLHPLLGGGVVHHALYRRNHLRRHAAMCWPARDPVLHCRRWEAVRAVSANRPECSSILCRGGGKYPRAAEALHSAHCIGLTCESENGFERRLACTRGVAPLNGADIGLSRCRRHYRGGDCAREGSECEDGGGGDLLENVHVSLHRAFRPGEAPAWGRF